MQKQTTDMSHEINFSALQENDSDREYCNTWINPETNSTIAQVNEDGVEHEASDEKNYGRGCRPDVQVVDGLAFVEEFPKDELDTALHSDQIAANYTERADKLVEWLDGKNSVDAVTTLLRAYGHTDCLKWKANLNPDALEPDTDEALRLFLVKRALHLSFLSVEDEDITNVLMAVNAPDNTHTWFVIFERQILPVMIRLGL